MLPIENDAYKSSLYSDAKSSMDNTVERRLSGQVGTEANPDIWTTLKYGYGNVSFGNFPSHFIQT